MFSGYRERDSNIFNQLNLIHRELESAFNRTENHKHINRTVKSYPPVNILSTDTSFDVELFASNLKSDAIEVTVDKGVLTIIAEKEVSENRGKALLKERVDTTVTRQVMLPEECDSENITADYKFGILTIKIAKREKAPAIKVKVH